MANLARNITAGILGLIGLFYAALPHSIHVNSGFGFNLSHPIHISMGVVLVIAAIVVYMVWK